MSRAVKLNDFFFNERINQGLNPLCFRNAGLVKMMLTLIQTLVSSIPREMCVRALNAR